MIRRSLGLSTSIYLKTCKNRPMRLSEKVYLTKWDGRVNQSFQMLIISCITVLINPKHVKILSEIDVFEVTQ